MQYIYNFVSIETIFGTKERKDSFSFSFFFNIRDKNKKVEPEERL